MFQIYESIPFGVVVLNKSSLTVEYVNIRLKDMLRLHEDIASKSIYHIEFFKDLSEEILECSKNEKEKKIKEVELIKDNFFSLTICSKFDYIEIYVIDITEEALEYRKRLEYSVNKFDKEKEKFLSISTELKTKCDIIEILRDREKEHLTHLKDVINNITEGLIVFDNNSKGKFSLCNRAAYKIIDLKMGEFFSLPTILSKYDIFIGDKLEEKLEYIYKELYKKTIPIKNLVAKLVDKNTNSVKYIELNSNPILNRKNELMYTIITLKDITEAKIHQINAEEQAKFVEDVVNNLDVPIAVIDYPELTYRLVNKRHIDIVSIMSKRKAMSKNIIDNNKREVMDLDESIYNIVCSVGEKGKQFNLSPYTLLDENGSERFYKIKFLPHTDSEGKVKRIHIHGLDITDEVNHNRELEKITRLKDEFFTVISHELRTPLTIIYSSLQLAYDIYGNEITYNLDKTLKRINQNCARLLKLINNILDLSKAEAGFLTMNCSRFDIVYVTEFIIGSVNLYAKSKGIELIFDTNEEEYAVSLDKDKYEKILLNLLSNSIKFTPAGKQILVTLSMKGDTVNLSVKDEGIGIPQDKLETIFDRFSQVNTSLSRRAEGTGIGLSLVKKLVEHMEGNIKVISTEGLGSEFIVEFNKESCTDYQLPYKVDTIDSNINDKIDIEFSDLN